MIRVRQIKVDVRKDNYDEIVRELCKKLRINKEIIKKDDVILFKASRALKLERVSSKI